MANLDLNTIALVSTLNPSPYNGSPSSQDYNDFQDQTLLDLTSVSTFINNVLIPMLVALPSNAISGLEGSSIYGDSTDQTALFYDSLTGQPLVLADSLRQLSALVSTGNLNVSNLSIQVGQLQQKLSSTNQNNIATTLQNLTNSLNVLTNRQIASDASLTAAQSIINKTQTKRVAITVPANTQANYAVTWPTPFLDNYYTTSMSIQDSTASIVLRGFVYQTTVGAGVMVNLNNTTASPITVTVNATGIHD